MNFNLIGYEPLDLPLPEKSKASAKEKEKERLEVFSVEPEAGAEDVYAASAAGATAYNFDLVSVPTEVAEQIKTYRRIAMSSDVDLAIKEIENEVFIFDAQDQKAVDIDFIENTNLSETIKKKIIEEFDHLYRNVIKFHKRGLKFFIEWYIDGRLYLYKVVDKNKPKEGIKELTQIDPLEIKKIREIPEQDTQTGTFNLAQVKEYFIWMQKQDTFRKGNWSTIQRAITIMPEAICHVDSGLEDRVNNQVISYIHKAIMPYNNLRLLEDSMIIYRVTRSPERRVIYVDVGNLPKSKAEQYMKSLMAKFKNKLVYDSQSGGLVDKKNLMTMVEDYYLPRRDNKATEITTLPGAQNDGIIEDVEYMRNKLYQALNVPINRFREDSPSFMFGKGTEIARDEYRFKKLIDRLRAQFCQMFMDLLKTQLILKRVISEDEWEDIDNAIQWRFAEDNYFVEFKESDVLDNRLRLLQQIEPYVGKYFTRDYVLSNVLHYTEQQIEQLNKEKENEEKDDEDTENEEDFDNV